MKKKCKKRLDKLAIDMANRAILEVESGLKKELMQFG